MTRIATLADKLRVEREGPGPEGWTGRTLRGQLLATAERHAARRAVAFQLKAGPEDRVAALTWAGLAEQVTRAANAFRRLGIGPEDTVAFVLPNLPEAVVALLAGATAGVVFPINPLLPPVHIGALLAETKVRVVVTLAPFPRTDVAERVAKALTHAPCVETVLEVDLAHYLPKAQGLAAQFMRPRVETPRTAAVRRFDKALAAENGTRLDFDEGDPERICAVFHTGGTTGMPKLARHRAPGILYNGWCGATFLFSERDVLLCPLPVFHVLAAYPVLMSCLVSGAEFVMATPQGYRGAGVIQNFWKLIARHGVTFVITVPTAAAVLMQRKVDADVASLRLAISGSAPMPVELFNRFEAATGVKILEGYGMTEATCLVAVNPPHGERKVGSVGLPLPFTDVRIQALSEDGSGAALGVDEVGEICVRGPGVGPQGDPERDRELLTPDGYLRTGDLGRIDADGYLWITGRAKDLIIRGGHNIDPAIIEEAMLRHPAVACAAAIGQPDAQAGEVPAVYVELCEGRTADVEELRAHVTEELVERAATPKHVEILPALPLTAIGKVFKPDLRRRAIARVYDEALARAGCAARVREVVEDRRLGLVAELAPASADQAARVEAALTPFVTPWRWASSR